MNDYNKLPSWKLVLLIKDCKKLLVARPAHAVPLKNTIELLRDLLIERQRV